MNCATVRRQLRAYKGMLRRLATGSATTTDVQLFVELLIQFLLLGIVCRHLLLYGLFRRRVRGKLLGERLQMADGCITWHSGRGACERGGIDSCVAENQDAADNRDGEKRAHGLLHQFAARGQKIHFMQTASRAYVTTKKNTH